MSNLNDEKQPEDLARICQYLNNNQECSAICLQNEGQEIRDKFCVNSKKNQCCYLCSSNSGCDVNCLYLGDIQNAKEKIQKVLARLEKLSNAEKYIKAGRYNEAAQIYDGLDELEKAGECRRFAKTSYVISANLNIAKIGSISMECPHCGASQPISSKSNEVTCSYCNKMYVIPKKVLELL
jgi:hypothetical protein